MGNGNNAVQLITYPDSLGGNLKSLKQLLDNELFGLFKGGIHILPPFPSSGDRGFSPINYKEIDPAFGTWNDIKSLTEVYDVMLDLMVNHISKNTRYFQDFLEFGNESQYADMFIPVEKYWKNGMPDRSEIEKIFLRRETPFSEYRLKKNGELVNVWTTFGKTNPSEQIDIDVNSKETKKFLVDIFALFSQYGIKSVRLDAIGYVIKKPGTSCFWVEPEIYQFLDWIHKEAAKFELSILPEVHGHFSIHETLVSRNFPTYDFILPYMVLSTLINKNSIQLIDYLKKRSPTLYTMLDCHDGVPVKPDLDGLVSVEDAQKIVDVCKSRGSNFSLVFSTKHQAENGFNFHQIRGTYYSMLDENDDAYVASRAIQLFIPGIHQLYYVGLLAGKNDNKKITETGDGREINRHNFSMAEITAALEKSVVKRIIRLIRFRNIHQAFNGHFVVMDSSPKQINIRWENGRQYCQLNIDLDDYSCLLTHADEKGIQNTFFV